MSSVMTALLAVKSLGDKGRFSGYASVFGVEDRDGDVMLPGAFGKTLAGRAQLPLLWQHDASEPVGYLHVLREDAHGLFVEGRLLLEVARAREAYALMKAGVLDGLSIGYRAVDYAIDTATGLRQLREVELVEVSLVTFPANEGAVVTQLKSLGQGADGDIRTFERFLRSAGFSRNRAKAIALYGFKGGVNHLEREDVADWCELSQALDRTLSIANIEKKSAFSIFVPTFAWSNWVEIFSQFGVYGNDSDNITNRNVEFDIHPNSPTESRLCLRLF